MGEVARRAGGGLEPHPGRVPRLGPPHKGEGCPSPQGRGYYRRRRFLPRARDSLTTVEPSAAGVRIERGARPNIEAMGASATSTVSNSPKPLKRVAMATP